MLGVVVVGSLVLAPDALANFISPKTGGSPNANQIHSLYNIVLYVAAIVAVLVEGALVYSVWRFRAKKSPVAAQIHGNTRLEIGWTVAAALILVVLTVVTFVKLPSIVNPPNSDANGLVLSASVNAPTPPSGKKLTVCIQGRQFIWRYVYSNTCLKDPFNPKLAAYSYTTMVVPAHTTIVLDIQSTDVIHSWWVPVAGRQGRRRPRLHDLHVVQGAAHRNLPRAVRAAVRDQPRGDGRLRQGGHADAVHRLARAPKAAHRGPERPGGPAAVGPHRLKSARKLRHIWRPSPAKTS